MPLQTESQEIEFIGDTTYIMNNPLKKYLIDFGEYCEILEASNMTTSDHGVVFEEVIIRGKDGIRLGIGRTFIEHGSLVGVTLITKEFGGMTIDNNTKLGLFTVINDDK